ncbi:TPA: S-methyl-5-thioribose-1-phosphate isomerase, partial [Candidatus Geothermarchaeota archaeon]|nr:S-methyl-5-thioribose-1-phosphate isomerase [Candidatus Geothermarchaeota archaeon]
MYLRSIEWVDGAIKIIDQTKLPEKLEYKYLTELDDVVEAIKNMRVRGAPLIGITAVLGLALVAYQNKGKSDDELLEILRYAYKRLKSSRPTAVNLVNMMNLLMEYARKNPDPDDIILYATRLMDQDIETNRKLSEYGSNLIEDGDIVLTHCNTGSLATVSIGTALGVILRAFEKGKNFKVVITETRPKLQGARITAFELLYAGIKPILIVDSAVSYAIKSIGITKIFVGADRILRDGTTFNKIGTYQIAITANYHNIPFYVVAPTSTLDLINDVEGVVIENRDG